MPTRDDILMIIDLQNDFLPPSGALSVPEGDQIIDPIIQLIDQFGQISAPVIATRDYHPPNHTCFQPKGLFPAHCVWGQIGSLIETRVTHALQKYDYVTVAFKGLDRRTDSYSAIPYDLEHPDWTGSVLIDQHKFGFPPIDTTSFDTLNQFASYHGYRPLTAYLNQIMTINSHIYLCGLAGDICVFETAQCLKQFKPTAHISIIAECIKYAKVNSMTDISMTEQYQRYGIDLTPINTV